MPCRDVDKLGDWAVCQCFSGAAGAYQSRAGEASLQKSRKRRESPGTTERGKQVVVNARVSDFRSGNT